MSVTSKLHCTMVCQPDSPREDHARCKATLEYQNPDHYDNPDEPIFLCECPCHGGLIGAILANMKRQQRDFQREQDALEAEQKEPDSSFSLRKLHEIPERLRKLARDRNQISKHITPDGSGILSEVPQSCTNQDTMCPYCSLMDIANKLDIQF
jgi:hypothetical protein